MCSRQLRISSGSLKSGRGLMINKADHNNIGYLIKNFTHPDMKIISRYFIVFIVSLYCHNVSAQERKMIELSLVKGKLADTALVYTRYTYRITKDSVIEEIYKNGKFFSNKAINNNPVSFTSEVLEYELSAWQNLAFKSRVLRCDTAPPLLITYTNFGKQTFFSISNTGGNCYPDDIKIFANKVFGLFKED